MTYRPQNRCLHCGDTWFPRGRDRSRKCPRCGSANVAFAVVESPPSGEPLDFRPLLTSCSVVTVLPLLACFSCAGLGLFVTVLGPRRDREESVTRATTPSTAGEKSGSSKTGQQKQPSAPTDTVAVAAPKPNPVTVTPMPPGDRPVVPDKNVVALETAPPPRPVNPFPPPPGWASEWDKAGDVRVRVRSVAYRQVPLVDRRRRFPSPEEYFVVWVEIENLSASATYTYRRWQPVSTGECTLRHQNGGTVLYAVYPAGAGREWFTEFTQELPPGGPPVIEALAFARPDTSEPGNLTLTLDATRVGKTGLFSFTIPRSVWAGR